MPTPHDPDVQEVLVRAFTDFVDELLDDPAWIAGEAPTYVGKLRKTAVWLEVDFDALLKEHYNKYEVDRLLRLERGEVFP